MGIKHKRALVIVSAAIACLAIASGIPAMNRKIRVDLNMYVGQPAGRGQVFYATHDTDFSQERSVSFDLRPGTFRDYSVQVPASEIGGLRLRIDPGTREGIEVVFRRITVWVPAGPRTHLYSAEPQKLELLTQIRTDERKPGLLRCTTLGEDPQVEFALGDLNLSSFLAVRVAVALILFCLVLLMAFDSPGISDETAVARYLIYITAFCILAAQGLYYVVHLPYDAPPDEHDHVCYLAHLRAKQLLSPDYRNRFRYDYQGNPTSKLNHLCHSPFYYNLLKPFVPPDPAAIIRSFPALRLINLALALAGLWLFLWIGCREKLPVAFHVYYAMALTTVPMLTYLAGSVNNNNLALVSGALAVYGAVRFLGKQAERAGLVYLGCGLALALMTKATAGLHVLFFTGLVVAYRLWVDRSPAAFAGPHALVFVVLCFFPFAYYVWTYYIHRSFTPGYGVIECINVVSPTPYSLPMYVTHFLRALSDSWTGIHSHRSFPKESWLATIPLLVPIGLAMIALFQKEGKAETEQRTQRFFAVHRLAAVATLCFLCAHFVAAYRTHSLGGYLGGVQARYYFALMPSVLILSFRPLLGRLLRPEVVLFLCAVVSGLIFSGFYHHIIWSQ